VVLVDETAEHVVTMDVEQWGIGRCSVVGHGYLKVDTTMRALPVVVIDIFTKYPFEMTLAQDEHPVEAFGPHRPDPTLRKGIGPRRSDRCLDHPDALGPKDLLEAGRELGVSIPNEELDGSTTVQEITDQVTGTWVTNAPVGWSVTPKMCTSRVDSSITNRT
jgi:hypothetical protein